jgi:hypothetical protein
MQPTTISIRRLVPTVVLALVLAAFGAGAAEAAGMSDGKAPGQAEAFVPGVTDFPSRLGEVGERAAEARLAQVPQQATPVKFVPGVTDFPSRLGEVGERAAEARLAQRSQQAQPVTLAIDEGGFDWSAGATGALAAALVVVGAGLAVRTAKRTRVALG